jgi:hypothetical protein
VANDSKSGKAAAKANHRALRLNLENGIFLIPFHAPMMVWLHGRIRAAV